MGTRVRTREVLLQEFYLNRTDIGRLLRISPSESRKVFDRAMELDQEQLGEWILYDNKVRIKSVLKVAGVDLNFLQKQIKTSA